MSSGPRWRPPSFLELPKRPDDFGYELEFAMRIIFDKLTTLEDALGVKVTALGGEDPVISVLLDALTLTNAPADAGATAGADWPTNLSGRPTELTDGRVATGLDSSGDLARNVITDRVIESSILAGVVALSKLKTETSNRIFTSDAKRTNLEGFESNNKLVAVKFASGNTGPADPRDLIASKLGGTGWLVLGTIDFPVGEGITSLTFDVALDTLSAGSNERTYDSSPDDFGMTIAASPGATPAQTDNFTGGGPFTFVYSNPPAGDNMQLRLYVKIKAVTPGSGFLLVGWDLDSKEVVPVAGSQIA